MKLDWYYLFCLLDAGLFWLILNGIVVWYWALTVLFEAGLNISLVTDSHLFIGGDSAWIYCCTFSLCRTGTSFPQCSAFSAYDQQSRYYRTAFFFFAGISSCTGEFYSKSLIWPVNECQWFQLFVFSLLTRLICFYLCWLLSYWVSWIFIYGLSAEYIFCVWAFVCVFLLIFAYCGLDQWISCGSVSGYRF